MRTSTVTLLKSLNPVCIRIHTHATLSSLLSVFATYNTIPPVTIYIFLIFYVHDLILLKPEGHESEDLYLFCSVLTTKTQISTWQGLVDFSLMHKE